MGVGRQKLKFEAAQVMDMQNQDPREVGCKSVTPNINMSVLQVIYWLRCVGKRLRAK